MKVVGGRINILKELSFNLNLEFSKRVARMQNDLSSKQKKRTIKKIFKNDSSSILISNLQKNSERENYTKITMINH